MAKPKKPEPEIERGLTGIRIRIQKLEKMRARNYEKLDPIQIQSLIVRRLDENNLLLRKTLGEDVEEELAKLRQVTQVDEDELERLYELEKEEMAKEAEADKKLKERMKKGENLLIKA